MKTEDQLKAITAALPEMATALAGALEAAAGTRVSIVVMAVPYEAAIEGHTGAALFSNECPHNRLIMIEGAKEMTKLELAQPPKGKGS